MNSVIKVCVDPHCEAVYHKCPVNNNKCNDCGGKLIRINVSTYTKKFSNNYFQYDFTTGNYHRPYQQLTLF